ncbi:hypothetical protein PIN31009_04419 [Pandoraea iniqua]|uniref:GspH/FimT family pseudopilin n=1 Tax=Pandoraea iniqua TaxID=2508288 RepID=UPI001241941B|nr:GspH/FimT family pseudopilin [Pandoraea iniqua]VVE46785.1 hypothetical protein PIN31009_04419 [Pandoraea iniqua]
MTAIGDRQTRSRGISLLECVVVTAVLAIAMMAAAPSIQAVRNRVAVEITARALLAAINTAKAEALGRHRRVTIAPHDGKHWNSGWVTFIDDNLNDRHDAGERYLARYAPLPAGVDVTTNWSLYTQPVVAFEENGFMRVEKGGWLSGNIQISGHERCIGITFNAYGRPRVAMTCNM